jgi:hypothetical protein
MIEMEATSKTRIKRRFHLYFSIMFRTRCIFEEKWRNPEPFVEYMIKGYNITLCYDNLENDWGCWDSTTLYSYIIASAWLRSIGAGSWDISGLLWWDKMEFVFRNILQSLRYP